MYGEWESIGLLNCLLVFWLPVAVIAAGAATVFVLVLRNRYARKLSLAEPEEEKKIRELAASGRISAEEAEALIEQGNSLPEVRETSPCPDLPLRIASALGRIYSLMKFALLAGTALFLAAIHLYASRPEFTGSYTFHAEHLPFLIVCAAVIAGLAVLEFIASVRILHGSFAARNFLIFNWIVNFALLRAAFVGQDSDLYLIPAIAGGGYILYVLLFRRGAAKKIRTGQPETTIPKKTALAVLLLAALATGLFFTAANYKNVNDIHSETSNMSTGFSGTQQSQIESILLIQGTPDRESTRFCRLLAKDLTKTTGIPCRIQRPEETAEWHDQMRNLAILVVRQGFTPPVSFLDKVSGKLRDAILKDIMKTAPEFEMTNAQEKLMRKMKNPVSFRLLTLQNFSSSTIFYKGLQLPDRAFSFRLSITGGSSAGVKSSVRRLAALAVEKLKPVFTQHMTAPRIKIPKEVPFAREVPPPLDPSALKNPKLLYKGHSFLCEGFYVWRFEMPNPEQDRKQITAWLNSSGFSSPDSYPEEISRFEKGDWEVQLITGKPRLPDGSSHGFLTCDNNIWKHSPQSGPDRKFLRRVADNDFRSFAIGGGLGAFSGEEFATLFRRIPSLSGLSLPEKLLIFGSINRVKDRGSAEKEYVAFQHSVIDKVIADSKAPTFLSNLETLFFYSREDRPLRNYLMQKIPVNFFADAVLPATPDQHGRYVLEKRVVRKPLIGSRVILNITVPGQTPLYFLAGVTRLADGAIQTQAGNSSLSAGEDNPPGNRCSDQNYRSFSRSDGWQDWGGTSGSDGREKYSDLPEYTKAGRISIRTKFYPAENSYSFGIIYIP